MQFTRRNPLCFADNPSDAAPTAQGRISKILEATGRLAGCLTLCGGSGEFGFDLLNKPVVLGETEEIIDLVFFTPAHQLVACEAKIGTQEDAHFWPARPQLRNDPGCLFARASRSIDVGAPELGTQKMPAAENVKRQVAITVIVAMKKSAFLMAMQGVIGRIKIENDLFWRHPMRFEKQVDEERLDG